MSAYAYQEWRKGKLARFTYCDTHLHRTSNFQGVGQTDTGRVYWLFRCPERPEHTSHIFQATPPEGVPSKPEEIQPWIQKQLEAERAEAELKRS